MATFIIHKRNNTQEENPLPKNYTQRTSLHMVHYSPVTSHQLEAIDYRKCVECIPRLKKKKRKKKTTLPQQCQVHSKTLSSFAKWHALNEEGWLTLRALYHFLESLGRPLTVLCQTTGKLVTLAKFCVTAILLSRLITTCHHPPGTNTVSPGHWIISNYISRHREQASVNQRNSYYAYNRVQTAWQLH